MADIIKVSYKDRPTIEYNEYLAKSAAALESITPKPGDRAMVMAEGKVYFCIEAGEWTAFGGDE